MEDAECAESKEKSDFSDFFELLFIFVLKITSIFDEIHDKSKNKNRKIDFSFVSEHCASFIKRGLKLRGGWWGGVCISLLVTGPIVS